MDVDAVDDGGLEGVFFRQDHAAEVLLLREERERERALDLADAAVEGELAGDQVVLVVVGLDEVGGAEEADGDGEVEAGGFFFDVGGCEGDEGAGLGWAEAAVDHGAFDALDGLLDAGLGEAGDDGLLHAGVGAVALDLAEEGVDADEDEGLDSGEHARVAP